MGIVNLFADITYEGGASINGPFLASLGASAAAVSIIAGAGEFFGYSLRSVAGYIADKTGRHWAITFLGYSINLAGCMPSTRRWMKPARHWAPLLIALVLFLRSGDSFRLGYGVLLGSSLLALAALVAARIIFPVPSRLEQGGPATAQERGFTRTYWLYMIGAAFFAAGLMSFELLSYHLASSNTVTAQWG